MSAGIDAAVRRILLAGLLSSPCTALGQGNPVGPEFRVNTATTGAQHFPTVAAAPSGRFVVSWASEDGYGAGVFGQRYESSGTPLGTEFQVNAYTTGEQIVYSVAVDSVGNFVIAWTGPEVFAQRYSSSGAPLGGEFQVNTYTTGNQFTPTVAFQPSGDFLIVWEGVGPGGPGAQVFGRHFAGSGAPFGPPFRINTYTTSNNTIFMRSVGSDSSGNFVVVWATTDGSSWGVAGQRLDAAGGALGPQFRVNTVTSGAQEYASVAVSPGGDFVVAWESGDGSYKGVFAQRFSAAGAPAGPEFRVNTATTNSQTRASVSTDISGNFVVVWQGPEAGSYVCFGQRYSSSGAPLGVQFRVNTYTTGIQMTPVAAADPSGNFVVVWQSYPQEGGSIFGQRFAPILPVELIGVSIE